MPLPSDGQQGHACYQRSTNPQQTAPQTGGISLKTQATEGEAQHKETIKSNDTDDKGGHLTGQKTQKTCHFTRGAVSPGCILPQVAAQVHPINNPNDRLGDTHEQISNAQMSDQSRKT